RLCLERDRPSSGICRRYSRVTLARYRACPSTRRGSSPGCALGRPVGVFPWRGARDASQLTLVQFACRSLRLRRPGPRPAESGRERCRSLARAAKRLLRVAEQWAARRASDRPPLPAPLHERRWSLRPRWWLESPRWYAPATRWAYLPA